MTDVVEQEGNCCRHPVLAAAVHRQSQQPADLTRVPWLQAKEVASAHLAAERSMRTCGLVGLLPHWGGACPIPA